MPPEDAVPVGRSEETISVPAQQAPRSLVDLGQSLPAKPAPKAVAPKPAPVRGDDLMGRAQTMSDFGDEEKQYINRFADSKQILDLKMQGDPAFAETTIKKLQNLTGEKLSNAVIDAADDIKIAHLKEKYPGRFNGGDALVTGLLDEASFGQLSRIYGKAGELLQGRPYEEVVKEKAEEIRLLQKAHPNMDLAGRAASYFMPGSPAKILFSGLAKVGLKVSGALLTRVANNPKLLQKAVQAVGNGGFQMGAKILDSAMVGGATAAGTGAVKGTLGQDLEGISLDRGAEQSLSTGIGGFLIGGAIPVAAAGIQKGADIARPAVSRVAKAGQTGLANLIETTTGVPKDALRAYNRDPRALRQAFNREAQIGRKLVDKLDELDAYKLPERVQADELLHQMPEMNAQGLIDNMRSIPSNVRPDLKSAYSKVAEEWAPWVEKKLGDPSKASPAKLRSVIDDLQKAAKDSYGKDAPDMLQLIKEKGALGRQMLLDHAGAQGEVGQVYTGLMEKVAEKRSIVSDVHRMLGRDDYAQAKNAEKFVGNLFGKNRAFEEARLSDLDRVYGTNFLEMARTARQARAVGAGGSAGALSQYATGKTVLGTAAGSAVGALADAVSGSESNTGRNVGGAVGLAFSSPYAAAKLLGASDNMSGFARRMFARPEVLQRLAKGAERGFPIEVQRVANMIQNSLTKDGPVSASSVMRIVADTPLFLGLVHAYDLAEKRMDDKTARSALTKARTQQQEIAKPNQ